MFLSSGIIQYSKVTAETLCSNLGLPRIEYGQALLDWYVEMTKIVLPEELRPQHHMARQHLLDRKILGCLREGPLDTTTLGKKVLGRAVWRRPISTVLHRMASDGLIIHRQEKDQHLWEITAVSPVSPIVVPGLPI